MHNRHILGKQHLVDSMLLSGVEPWETDRGKGEFLGLAMVVEQVAQLSKAVALCLCHAVNGLEHKLVGVFVKR